MRKIYGGIICMLFLFLTFPGMSQKMTWTTKSDEAKNLAMSGAKHMMNAEFAQAYDDFTNAVKLDPDFTVPLVFLSNLSRGAMRDTYAERALKSAKDKTEGEKLFASLDDSTLTRANRLEVWSKLHTMFPDGAMIGHFYVLTRPTAEERFSAAQDYIKKFPDAPGMYNNLAYLYLQDKKDTLMAKQYFEKYIAMYPDGCNPYDSMGEFYLDTGDTANAEKYYTLALEKYPFNNSSIDALQKINDAKKK